jgi:Transcriptional regulator
MPSKSPQTKSELTRQKILSSASELFLRGGVQALSVRAIAKAAGISTIGIYSHFQGKQGILDTLYIEGFEHVYATSSGISKQASRGDVLDSVQAYLTVAEKYEAHYRLIFGEVDTSYSPSEKALAVRDKAFSSLIKLADAYLLKNKDNKEKQRFALDLWSMVHGYVSLAHHGLRDQSQPRKWHKEVLRAVNVYLDGYAIQQ